MVVIRMHVSAVQFVCPVDIVLVDTAIASLAHDCVCTSVGSIPDPSPVLAASHTLTSAVQERLQFDFRIDLAYHFGM